MKQERETVCNKKMSVVNFYASKAKAIKQSE